ncbi:MAG: cysteine desulfurase [Candidatus Magasanikbacteria bacterium GW2011_GWA2_56_11]|uniref:cysteine desulfurase n=1 Tax=Candidatus Magasanikbacteria bacterium GW2011_GWA2_56_11 TaxID=1619044 RepID=A0A0G1YGH6_9BACT|nr:MAG: cysteine desulfurase [Candidatus Magasanikbacteria bacterium GW2011_GWA2_56_11]
MNLMTGTAAKQHFALFARHPHLAYLDNAASTQTPQAVVGAMASYYTGYRANIHRGVYELSALATGRYENARGALARFINASADEIIFTSGTTAGLNWLALRLTQKFTSRDNVVLTRLEHHANLVPWQQAAKERGFSLRFVELTPGYEIDLASARTLIDENTKVVGFALVSNTLGTISPARELIALAHERGALTIVDAAQAAAHLPLDVRDLEADFVAFSGHKMYGPTGSGVLFGRREHLRRLEPLFYGGEMVSHVTYETAEWAGIPERFEAGTPAIAEAIGLGAAAEFITGLDLAAIRAHETRLTEYALEKVGKEVKIIGPADISRRTGVVSFVIKGAHPHDIADILDKHGVVVRAGHHCTMPLMRYLGLTGATRASLGVYSTAEDIDRLVEGVRYAKKVLCA